MNNEPDYKDNLAFEPKKEYVQVEKEVYDVILANSVKWIASQENNPIKRLISVLLSVSPKHRDWLEKNFKDYMHD